MNLKFLIQRAKLMLWYFLLFGPLQLVSCCGPGEYPIRGLCCPMCTIGNRVLKHCTAASSTRCRTCTQGEYIDHPSGLEKCFKCETCDSAMGLIAAEECTYIQNSICHCQEGYFCLERKGTGCEACKKHSLGPVGEGLIQKGTIWDDAVYEKCPHGTYSDTVSSEECKRWTNCEQSNKLEIRPGNSSKDSECKEKTNLALIVSLSVITAGVAGVVVILMWKRQGLSKCRENDIENKINGDGKPKVLLLEQNTGGTPASGNDSSANISGLKLRSNEEELTKPLQTSDEDCDSGIATSSNTSGRTNSENRTDPTAKT